MQLYGFLITMAQKGWKDIIWTLVGLAIQWWLLYMAGLFDKYIG